MLVFIDESGYPSPTDNNPKSSLACLCVKEADLRQLTTDLFKLKENIFGPNTGEFKSNNFIKEKVITKNMTNNKEFTERLIQMILDFDLKVFGVVVDRPVNDPKFDPEFLEPHYYYLMKRIQYYCEQANESERFKDRAIFIFDETNGGPDAKRTKQFLNFLYKSKEGKNFDYILEMPLFVDSKTTAGIQIVDFVVGIIRKSHELGVNRKTYSKSAYNDWLHELYNKINDSTINFKKPKGGYEYGIVSGISFDKKVILK